MNDPQRNRDVVVDIVDVSKVYEPSPLWMKAMLRSALKEPVQALDSVTFSVRRGEVCAIVGPNGAGKSTLFRVLTGLTTPTTGRATILGRDCTTDSRKVRRNLGFMPADERSLFLRQTCAQNLDFHGRLQGVSAAERRTLIDETLELVGLAHARDRSGFALSTGMRARLQLARALLHRPQVLILDEPTGTVDPIGAHQLLNQVQKVSTELRIAVLLSSHRLEEIDALGDNVAFLDRGQLVHWGTPRVVIRLSDTHTADVVARKLEGEGLDVERSTPTTVLVSTDMGIGAVLGLLGDEVHSVVSVEAHQMPLRDLLAKLVQLRDRSEQVRGVPT
jgi:ABC-2 type transport system ATP-binding protein